MTELVIEWLFKIVMTLVIGVPVFMASIFLGRLFACWLQQL